jgi:dTDP-4-dehydrorhamnose reductase
LTTDLAAGIAHLLGTGAPDGTYNLTCDGEPTSWAEVAAAVFEARGRAADDEGRVSTPDYFADKPQAAPRPLNSVLNVSSSPQPTSGPGLAGALTEYLAA